MYTAFNSAFLVRSGSDVFYKRALNDGQPDGTWSASLDILGAEDAYERTGDPAKKALVNDLLNTWLKNTPPPWSWDGWNDDIGWFTLALIRGYQMTGNPPSSRRRSTASTMRSAADGTPVQRRWHLGGEPGVHGPVQPSEGPEQGSLANDSLGKVACMIYQSTHDVGYLNKCQQIYDWVWSHLYNPSTGAVYARIEMDGTLNKDTAAYNQGTFADYANLLWEITGNVNIYNDAKRAIDYARNNLTWNGVFANGAPWLNTWADEMARGAGHFVRDNRQWDGYYSWMVQNADAIQANRRTDLGITWNVWDKKTPNDNTLSANQFVSAMAWLQFTPPVDRTASVASMSSPTRRPASPLTVPVPSATAKASCSGVRTPGRTSDGCSPRTRTPRGTSSTCRPGRPWTLLAARPRMAWRWSSGNPTATQTSAGGSTSSRTELTKSGTRPAGKRWTAPRRSPTARR
ncbi:glycoside hydrolase family 76 protein [Micromonospora sp. M12]